MGDIRGYLIVLTLAAVLVTKIPSLVDEVEAERNTNENGIEIVDELEFNIHSITLGEESSEENSDKFFLGTKSKHNKMYYYFYREAESGGLFLDSVRADKVKLFVTLEPGEVPYYKGRLMRYSFFLYHQVELYLPKDFIKKDMDTDLQKNLSL